MTQFTANEEREMDILNAEEQRDRLDMLRRLDFSDAALLFGRLIQLAHQTGVVDGGKQVADAIIAKMENNDFSVQANPAATLERDIRATVLSKFAPRGHLPEGSQ